jgi:hypothetical protein
MGPNLPNALELGIDNLVNYCLECGGILTYDSTLKQYSCKSCGLTFTPQQLLEGRDRARFRDDPDEERKRRHKDYLNWWLSKK